MTVQDDNETWLIETGHEVIERKASVGLSSLRPWEHLVYCLWVADYGMRNAGDLDTAHDLHAVWKSEGRMLADQLSLPLTRETFGLSTSELEKQYFDLFDGVCSELRALG